MRIISQDGCMNIPYEKAIIQLYKKHSGHCERIETGIYARVLTYTIDLGYYSTKEQARDVMNEMILVMAEAENNHYVYQMPKDEGKNYIK